MKVRLWLYIILLSFFAACCPLRNATEEREYLSKFDSKIDQLVMEGKIREDQAQARKAALRQDIDRYKSREVVCKEVKKKALYLKGAQ